MRLYFLRHAAAVEHPDDTRRQLSDTGRRQARKIGRFLRRAEIVFDAAYTSPLIRARETAEIVLAITNEVRPAPLHTAGVLLNSTSTDDFLDWARSLSSVEHVLLVGHEPSLGEHVRRLLGLDQAATFEMKKGACALIRTLDCRSGLLKFLVTPAALGA